MRALRILLVPVLVALCLTGLPASPAHAYPPDPPDAATSRNHLDQLDVAAPHSMEGYDREKFPHWSEQSGNCDTREAVLRRDGVNVSVGDDCYPSSGRWYSVYDATWVEDPSEVHIDHVVALANAWRSGADEWSTARRQRFANSLAAQQLIAVSGESNLEKSDESPAEWKPENTGYWCMYARSWVNVKYTWELSITNAEKTALEGMLGRC